MPLSKVGDGVVIGMLIGGQITIGQISVGRAFDLARAWLADGVGVEQKPSHHLGMISRFPATIGPLIVVNNGAQIQFPDKVCDEAGQMTFWQPVLQVGRE